jgi:hypothetical protein
MNCRNALFQLLTLTVSVPKISHAEICCVTRDREGHAVAHLVEALCYKPEGRGFDS